MNFLTEEQLKNLTTERLNNLRRTVTPQLGKLGYQVYELMVNDEKVIEEYRAIAKYYGLIKEVLSTREHLEKASQPNKGKIDAKAYRKARSM